MRVRFHSAAKDEFLHASKWYEEQRSGLGEEFIVAIQTAIAAIVSDPFRFQPVAEHARIFRVKKFPYCIYFRVLPEKGVVRVLSIMHNSRHPDTWKGRY